MENIIEQHHKRITSTLLLLSTCLMLFWLLSGLGESTLWLGLLSFSLPYFLLHWQPRVPPKVLYGLKALGGGLLALWLFLHLFDLNFWIALAGFFLAAFIDKRASHRLFHNKV